MELKPTIDISAHNEEAFRNDLVRYLLEIKPTIAIKESFIRACRNGHIDIVRYLLEVKPTIDISAEDEEAFRWACEKGHVDIVRYLLQLKPTIDISANNEEAFITACRYDNIYIVRIISNINPFKYQYHTGTKFITPHISLGLRDCDKCYQKTCEELVFLPWIDEIKHYVFQMM